MAEEEPESSPWENVVFVVGLILVLAVLWFMNGGPQRADLHGIFLNPPTPVGAGGAYGPQVGSTSITQYQSNQ